MDLDRSRAGQYVATLKRDILGDFWDEYKSQPIYVEKGYINDLNSPLLCNNEGLVVNQIKKSETRLYDETQCPWICMYLKKGALGSTSIGNQGKVAINVPENDGEVYEVLQTPIGQWSMYDYTDDGAQEYSVIYNDDYNIYTYFSNQGVTLDDYEYMISKDGTRWQWVVGSDYTTNLRGYASNGTIYPTKAQFDNVYKSQLRNLVSAMMTDNGLNTLQSIQRYNDKVIKDSDGKYYRATVYMSSGALKGGWATSSAMPVLKGQLNALWNQVRGETTVANDKAFRVRYTVANYKIKLTELDSVETTVDFSQYTGNGTEDSPLFDVLCMPYGEVYITNPSEFLHGLTTSKDRSMKVMSSLATQLTDNWVLDLQILPYCPCRNLIGNFSDPTMIPLDVRNSALTGYKQGLGYTDCLFVAPSATFSLDIFQTVDLEDESDVDDIYKIKYKNDCTMVRLVSPNHNGIFEFNLAKNGGNVDYFNADVTLRPYNPYIHVNPNFKFLYGRDFDDARGLICGGDFSLGILNSAWAQYEIQNKNYQAIFDRQIQNMDVNNSIARQEGLIGAITGSIQGGMAGLAAGAQSGNPYVAAAGAAAGAGMGTLGGILDYQNLEKKIKENRSFAIDNFNLQLGNVKALPGSVTKTSCLTANFKEVPFIEIYECEEVEKQAYYNKLKYDGMTVGIISKAEDFAGHDQMFKGKLIRNTVMQDDTHIFNELNNELMKGVYI